MKVGKCDLGRRGSCAAQSIHLVLLFAVDTFQLVELQQQLVQLAFIECVQSSPHRHFVLQMACVFAHSHQLVLVLLTTNLGLYRTATTAAEKLEGTSRGVLPIPSILLLRHTYYY